MIQGINVTQPVANFGYEEVPSQAGHVWIELMEYGPYTTYSRPIGMIKPVLEGYLAVGTLTEETFPTFAEAKAFIIEQEEKDVCGK